MTDLTDEYLCALQDALLSGEQADMDGCRVKVSRQACEEAAAVITALRQREATAVAGAKAEGMREAAAKVTELEIANASLQYALNQLGINGSKGLME